MHHKDLICDVESPSYDFDAKIGKLNVPQHNPPDMGGCKKVFRAIDKDVMRIEVFENGKLATVYTLKDASKDEWDARLL